MKATTTEVDKITKTKYGAMTITAAASTEKAVKFVTLPAATSGTMKLTVAGSTDVAGFVYCAVSKNPSARMRMLSNTTAAANTTSGTATPDSMTAAATKEKYNIKRATTTATALTFSFEFTGL